MTRHRALQPGEKCGIIDKTLKDVTVWTME